MSTSPSLPPASDADQRWAQVFERVNGVLEGGTRFTDDPADHGGATRWGVSLRFLAQECRVDPALISRFKIGHDGAVTVQDVRQLTRDQASGVSRECFWAAPSINLLAQPFDAACYDLAYNEGITPAVELLQDACNAITRPRLRLPVDGELGPRTLDAVHTLATGQGATLLSTYRGLAAQRYQAIATHDPTQHRFLPGWLSRAEHLGDV